MGLMSPEHIIMESETLCDVMTELERLARDLQRAYDDKDTSTVQLLLRFTRNQTRAELSFEDDLENAQRTGVSINYNHLIEAALYKYFCDKLRSYQPILRS